MKIKSTVRCLFALVLLSTAAHSVRAQASSWQNAATVQTASVSGSSKARPLDTVVASVGSHQITRREMMRQWFTMDRQLRIKYLVDPRPASPAKEEAALVALDRYMIPAHTDFARPVVSDLMIRYALEQTAAQNGIVVDEAAVKASLHRDLDIRRRSANYAEASDQELADKFGVSLVRMREMARRRQLESKLIVADMYRQFGHPAQPDDFYHAHMIYIAAPKDEQGAVDIEAAKVKAEALRAAIAAGEKKFEEVAKSESGDNTAQSGGDLGVWPRTLLRHDLETALLALPEGGLTSVLPATNGCVFFQLDQRAAGKSDESRKHAEIVCLNTARRRQEALHRMLVEVVWTNQIGETPEWYRRNVGAP